MGTNIGAHMGMDLGMIFLKSRIWDEYYSTLPKSFRLPSLIQPHSRFLFWQRERSILSRGVEYALYLIQVEFSHSKHIYDVSFTTSMRDALSSSKSERMWNHILQVRDQVRSQLLDMILMLTSKQLKCKHNKG